MPAYNHTTIWQAPPYRNYRNFSKCHNKYDRAWQPPLSGPDAGSFIVVLEKLKQLIRKTWETTKRDVTDKLGLVVQPLRYAMLATNLAKPVSHALITNSII
jgi:hypothetical protein